MIAGFHQINLDAKGRLALPTAHRAHVQEGCQNKLVVTISLRDPCLFVYPFHVFKEVERTLLQLSSTDRLELTVKQMILAHASHVEVDGSGRILIPAGLRDHASLQKHLCVYWEGNKYCIWDNDRWLQHKKDSISSLQENFEGMSETIRGLSL